MQQQQRCAAGRGHRCCKGSPSAPDLQVLDGYGKWQAVNPLGEDQVLLMPGHTLEYALCGLLPSAKHRLVGAMACALAARAAAVCVCQQAPFRVRRRLPLYCCGRVARKCNIIASNSLIGALETHAMHMTEAVYSAYCKAYQRQALYCFVAALKSITLF